MVLVPPPPPLASPQHIILLGSSPPTKWLPKYSPPRPLPHPRLPAWLPWLLWPWAPTREEAPIMPMCPESLTKQTSAGSLSRQRHIMGTYSMSSKSIRMPGEGGHAHPISCSYPMNDTQPNSSQLSPDVVYWPERSGVGGGQSKCQPSEEDTGSVSPLPVPEGVFIFPEHGSIPPEHPCPLHSLLAQHSVSSGIVLPLERIWPAHQAMWLHALINIY